MATYTSQMPQPPSARTQLPSRLPTKGALALSVDTLPRSAPSSSSRIPSSSANAQRRPVAGRTSPLARTGTNIPSPTMIRPSPSSRAPSSRGAPHVPVRESTARTGDFVPAITPTPSLVSASSMSTQDSPRSKTLRRKPSVIGTYVSTQRARNEDVRVWTDASMPEHNSLGSFDRPVQAQQKQIYDPMAGGLEATYQQHIPEMLPSHTPMSEPSSVPSLRHLDSPGGFSRTTTPTTHTSYSPLVAVSPQIGGRPWGSPIRASPASHIGPRDIPEKRSGISPSEPYGHPFFRESAAMSASQRPIRTDLQPPTKTNPQSPPSTTKTRSRLAKPRPTELTGNKKANAKHPPELAHLMVDPPRPQTTSSIPPPRPSRDGTPSLADQQGPFSVVYSNLSGLVTSPHARQRSQSFSKAEGIVSSANANGKIPESPSRRMSRSQPAHAQDEAPVTSPEKSVNSTTTKSGSRFGFFTRRAKVDGAPDKKQQPVKPSRKGPVAGTGHEGYGKYASRSRSGSSTSVAASAAGSASGKSTSNSIQRRKSNSSQGTDSDVDDFLAQRLKPVYLRGDGPPSEARKHMKESPRCESSQSIIDDDFQELTLSPGSIKSSEQTKSDTQGFRIPRPETPPTVDEMSRADDIAVQEPSRPPHLESRQQGKGFPLKNGSNQRHEPAVSSSIDPNHATSNTRSQTTQHIPISEHAKMKLSNKNQSQGEDDAKPKKGNWSLFAKAGQRTKTPPKWNVFQRNNPSSAHAPVQPELPSHTEDLEVPKSAAHYAMLDSDDDRVLGYEDLARLLQEAKDASDGEYGLDRVSTVESGPIQPVQRVDSINSDDFRSPPSFAKSLNESSRDSQSTSSDMAFADRESIESSRLGNLGSRNNAALRPSRLAQVGRIPKVVSKRDRYRRLPDQSFSRPFISTQPKPIPLSTLSGPAASDPMELSPQSSHVENTTVLIDHDIRPQASNPPSSQPSKRSSIVMPTTRGDFWAFQRKNSDVSYSSSSGTYYFPTAVATAIIPGPGSPPSEDEVWAEFDDLIDNVLGSATSTSPPKSDYFTQRSKYLASSPSRDESDQRLGSNAPPELPPPAPLTTSTSQIRTIPPAPAPNTALPATPILDSSSSRTDSGRSGSKARRATISGSDRLSGSTSRSSVQSQKSIKRKRSTSNLELSTHSKSESMDTTSSQPSQKPVDPQSMANLRFGALMTSKWLTFGRVLFSPVHFELGSAGQDKVLIVDGLGKDWSYYCALTYPDTMIYSLGPAPASSASHRGSLGGWQSLPNHQHFSLADMTKKFPFENGQFIAVVLRFPAALSDKSLESTLSECKRVLRPGGYLEVSCLDLDLNNMGNIGRRALRNLKMRIHATSPEISLKPLSDNIQFLLGREGFLNINRCIVGVPAAGVISNSREQSREEKELSLTQLVNDSTQEGDESITKTVARVGRWWYSKCYEGDSYANGNLGPSIWSDMALLRECERLSTTFRLFVGYAQKPTSSKRRTVSL